MPVLPGRRGPVAILATVLATTVLLLHAQGPDATVRSVPADLDDVAWLDARGAAQVAAADRLGTFHDFRFADRLAESGITFRSRVVDDAAKYYKAVHYDHGFGLAVADVDGDSLPDLYFVSQVGGSQLWKNTGRGRFRDVTAEAGVAAADRVGASASFADIDNDGDADLFVTTVRGGNLLFENDGKGRFRDITAAAGVGYVGHSSAGVFFDYDRDGRLDLFLVNVGRYTSDAVGGNGYRYFIGYWDAFSSHLMPERAERSILYRNLGGNRFADVTEQTGLVDTSWSGDATPIDVNCDGWLDLYVLNMQGDDQYYENDGGRRFVRRSRDVFPRTSWGAMGVKVFDANGDGRLDLFTTDMHSDMSANVGPEHEHMKSHITWPESFRGDGSTSIWGNALFLNDGPGRFREASESFGVENYWPWGPSAGDLNADGFDDLFITSGMNYPFRYGTNAVKLNNQGRGFEDAEFILGVEPRRGGVSLPWFELDASGADRGHEAAAGATGRVVVRGAKGSRSSAMVDLDADGDLDIVTNEFNDQPMVLVSDLSARRRVNYLNVVLAGTTSNRSGLGAVVTVVTASGRSTKVMDGRSGYLSQSLQPLYFGLGDARGIDRVDVQWPSGRTQAVTRGIRPNATLTIREP
jgi:hypothetical protein